jgi:hypothetical protein
MIAFIATDSDGEIWLYTEKPEKNEDMGYWFSSGKDYPADFIEDQFPHLSPKWTDEKPIQIEIHVKAIEE